MALDATARKANVKDSVKKYFVDALEPDIPVMFDTSTMLTPIGGAKRWVVVWFGKLDPSNFATLDLRIFCCVDGDIEGFRLAQLRDTVVGLLVNPTMNDGMQRIPFYRSYADQAWETLGAILVNAIEEQGEGTLENNTTKFVLLTVTLRWPSKV